MSIRLKVLIAMLTAFLVVTILLGVFMYSNFNDIIIKQVKSDINGVMLENTQSFDNVVRGISRAFTSISYNEFVVDAIISKEQSFEEKYEARSLIAEEVKNIFELVLDSYIDSYTLHFYVNSEYPVAEKLGSENYYPFRNLEFGIYSTDGVAQEKWFKETISENKPWHCFYDEKIPGYVFFSKAISANSFSSAAGNEFIGMGVVGIDCRQLIRDMGMRTVTDDVMIAIVDSENHVVCKSEKDLSDEFIVQAARENAAGFGEIHQLDTDDYLITMAKTDSSLTFVTFTTKDSIYLQSRDVKQLGILAIGMAILVAAILIMMLSYYLTKPIKKLSSFMRGIDYDNLGSLRVESKSKDEVGELYKSVNTMLDTIKKALERENEHNEKARQMEIQMLQAQINPHFLYNVLDSISWIAMENGQDKILEMADLLSQIFAYSIKDRKILASIADELENVEKYVKLQKNRYTQDIKLQIDADSECLDFSAPKCILQPLVENSIIHGLCGDEESICIKITVRRVEEGIKILISDDGKGEDIEKINAILSGEDEDLSKYHLGIRNVVARIKQLYGIGYGLSYSVNEGGGILAKILLPAKKDNQN